LDGITTIVPLVTWSPVGWLPTSALAGKFPKIMLLSSINARASDVRYGLFK
jgi:hypothetical protein